MRYSQLLIPTVKEVPADAEIPSHRLMIRAGFIRKVASGTYTYLPLGLRMLQKAAQIVRDEMNASGAQEIAMPILQPIELWARTGRDTDYGETMCKFTDRHGRVNVLAPTAEEVVTTLVAADIRSYKQLPLNLYQIQTKFRDEFRPRFGVLRSREFLMKDAYSFDTDLAGLESTYKKMYEAYCRIFDRCGVKYVVVEAESGPIGGSASHEFMAPCPTGEDIIVHTEDYSYAANIEKAEIDAVGVLASARHESPPTEEVYTPGAGTIDDVCDFLKTKPEEMIKTIVYWERDDVALDEFSKSFIRLDTHSRALKKAKDSISSVTSEIKTSPNWEELVKQAEESLSRSLEPRSEAFYKSAEEWEKACNRLTKTAVMVLVRGSHDINESKLCGLVGKTVEMAPETVVRMVSRAEIGFAGPVGRLKKLYKLVIDYAVASMSVGVTGASKTNYHTKNVVPGRDFPLEGDNVIVADIRNAVEGDTRNGKPLQFSRGIEIGHVFKLGTKYSEKLGATYLDENGSAKPCVMGCYGIGINRIIAAAIEVGNDKNGCILPPAIAPFEVEVMILNNDSAEVVAEAERIYAELAEAGADVLLDDRDTRAGAKFKDADLIGIPLRVVVGERGLKEGNVEIKRRTDDKPAMVAAKDAVAETLKILEEMKA